MEEENDEIIITCNYKGAFWKGLIRSNAHFYVVHSWIDFEPFSVKRFARGFLQLLGHFHWIFMVLQSYVPVHTFNIYPEIDFR